MLQVETTVMEEELEIMADFKTVDRKLPATIIQLFFEFYIFVMKFFFNTLYKDHCMLELCLENHHGYWMEVQRDRNEWKT